MAWDRTTPWRQGHVLTDEAARTLGLSHEGGLGTAAVVISHDCDIAQSEDREPRLEVIVGCFREKPDGNLTHAKNSRKVHLSFVGSAGALTVELEATRKASVAKSVLENSLPNANISLTSAEQNVLQRWLAIRYRRSAFPDGFDRRLENAGLPEKLKKALRVTGRSVAAVFFDVDAGAQVERLDPNDPYQLGIYLLYDTSEDLERAKADAAQAQRDIEKLFKEAFWNRGSWKEIELLHCDVVSDEALSYKQSTMFKKWSADHVSLRAQPAQPLLA